MKTWIERVVLVFGLFFMLPFITKADDGPECDVHVKYELGVHASHITYDVTFIEDSATFNISIENVNSNLVIEYGNKEYKASSKGITIKGVEQGKNMSILVKPAPNTDCDPDGVLRTISYQTPYYNKYLNSDQCLNYPELQVCQTKFYGYELTYELFDSMLTKQRYELYGDEEPEEPIIEETDKWKEILFDFLYKYGMQILLFVLGTGSVIILGQSALKRAKAKF